MAISVFPERMNELDREEPKKALGTLESYIHYMCERVEFSLSNFFRQINEYGTSAAGTSIILAAHDNSINQLTAEQTALTQAVGGKAEQSALDDLAGTVEELSDTVDGMAAILAGAGPIIWQDPADVAAAVNTDVSFSVRAVGTGLSYQWQINYSQYWQDWTGTGGTTDTMTVKATSTREGARVRCVVTDGQSRQAVSGMARLTVTT